MLEQQQNVIVEKAGHENMVASFRRQVQIQAWRDSEILALEIGGERISHGGISRAEVRDENRYMPTKECTVDGLLKMSDVYGGWHHRNGGK